MIENKFSYVIAEDEERMRDYLARKIADFGLGFECVGSAEDGEEAVELVERFMPELLITDIKMPVLGGLELIKRIRETNPDMRVVIVSGYKEFDYAKEAIELGVDEYLLKPLDLSTLRDTLGRIRIRLESSFRAIDSEFRVSNAQAGGEDFVRAVKLFLQENYRQPYSLEKLAVAFGCKAAYLLRLYRRVTGSTPTQELIRLRIAKAKRLLAGHPDLEIKQVAAAVGYDDPLYFSRLFKRETGSSPTLFRDSMGQD
jgi:two-component system, response regulator YesN